MTTPLHEIDAAVARIEGCHYDAKINRWVGCDGTWLADGDAPPPYSTDWAWCGPLIEKYDIHVRPIIDEPKTGNFIRGKGWLATIFSKMVEKEAATPKAKG